MEIMKRGLILAVLVIPLIFLSNGCSNEGSVTAEMQKNEETIRKMKAGELTIEDELGPLNLKLPQDRYKARELVVRNVNRDKKKHEKKLEDESGETAEKERIKESIKKWMERVE